MQSNTLFFGWNRAIPDREIMSQEHFQDLINYLNGQQNNGTIESFTPVFLDNHGGDLNGFFLIHGDSAKLDAMCNSDEWIRHMSRAAMHLDGSGCLRGVTGDALAKRFAMWVGLIP